MTITRTVAPYLALGFVAVLSATTVLAKDKKPIDPNKRICRSDVLTGSRFPVKLCHTAAEWAQIDGGNGDAAQTMLDRATRNGLGATGGGDGR